MGYHRNEDIAAKAVKDAQRFINDRERFKYLSQILMDHMGMNDDQIIFITLKAQCADFESVRLELSKTNK